MANTTPGDESRTIKSVEKTLHILEALKRLDGAGISELAGAVNMSHGSVHHHLMSLQKHGYVVKHNNEYFVGIRFFSLGGYARQKQELYRESREKIDELANQTTETARLVVEHRGHCITLYQSSVPTSTASIYTGFEERPHSTAAGKAILAAHPPDRVDEILEYHGLPERTENTITDEFELRAELETVRNRGYAVDNEECVEGLFCIADSIATPDGTVLGAISVSAPVDRIDTDGFVDEIAPLINNATGVLEISHTYHPWETE